MKSKSKSNNSAPILIRFDWAMKRLLRQKANHHYHVLQLTTEEKAFFVGENRHYVKNVKDLYPEYYIICVEDFDNVAKNSLDEWIYFLKNNEIPDKFKAPGLKEARKLLQYDKLSEQEKIDYDYHLDQKLYERGSIKTALFKGRFRGRAESMETVVINCHRNGLQPEMIVAITDLTPAQIITIFKKHGLA